MRRRDVKQSYSVRFVHEYDICDIRNTVDLYCAYCFVSQLRGCSIRCTCVISAASVQTAASSMFSPTPLAPSRAEKHRLQQKHTESHAIDCSNGCNGCNGCNVVISLARSRWNICGTAHIRHSNALAYMNRPKPRPTGERERERTHKIRNDDWYTTQYRARSQFVYRILRWTRGNETSAGGERSYHHRFSVSSAKSTNRDALSPIYQATRTERHTQ